MAMFQQNFIYKMRQLAGFGLQATACQPYLKGLETENIKSAFQGVTFWQFPKYDEGSGLLYSQSVHFTQFPSEHNPGQLHLPVFRINTLKGVL